MYESEEKLPSLENTDESLFLGGKAKMNRRMWKEKEKIIDTTLN